MDTHPLGGQGGDQPNPISLNQNGAVTFTAAGTFGFTCLVHSSMKGAIRVVPAATAVPVPALSPLLAFALLAFLLATGTGLLRRRSRQRDQG